VILLEDLYAGKYGRTLSLKLKSKLDFIVDIKDFLEG